MSFITIFDIKRFAVHDGPGIRTTVFLKGCPLDCWWCHNPESRKSEPEEVVYTRMLGDKELDSKKIYGKSMHVSEVMGEILKDKLFFEESGGGVTFSGGEPLNQTSVLKELLEQCKKHGLHTTIDTCGHAQWTTFEKIIPYTDLFLYDLKLIDPTNHEKFAGVKNELIIENLQKLLCGNVKVELRIPVVPAVNDTSEEVENIVSFLQNKLKKVPKIHLLPYHQIGDNKYQKLNVENRMVGLNSCGGLTINEFKNELSSIGFDVEIGG